MKFDQQEFNELNRQYLEFVNAIVVMNTVHFAQVACLQKKMNSIGAKMNYMLDRKC